MCIRNFQMQRCQADNCLKYVKCCSRKHFVNVVMSSGLLARIDQLLLVQEFCNWSDVKQTAAKSFGKLLA